jgi:hypothetical protein
MKARGYPRHLSKTSSQGVLRKRKEMKRINKIIGIFYDDILCDML